MNSQVWNFFLIKKRNADREIRIKTNENTWGEKIWGPVWDNVYSPVNKSMDIVVEMKMDIMHV